MTSTPRQRLAYLVLAHTDPEHLARLIRTLDYASDFYIHIDKKSDIAPFSRATDPLPVCYLRNRVKIHWGTFSQVLATLDLLRAASSSNVPYAKLILLTGACYPIKPPGFLHNVLASNPQHNHIQFLRGCESSHHMRYVRHYWIGYSVLDQRSTNGLLPKALRRPLRQAIDATLRPFQRDLNHLFAGMMPCFGGSLFAVSLDCAKYVLELVDRNPDLSEAWRYTFAPDEHFFHTLIASSQYATLSDGFTTPGEMKEAYRDLASLHMVAPAYDYFCAKDFLKICESDKLFIRKVSSKRSRALLDRIDAELL